MTTIRDDFADELRRARVIYYTDEQHDGLLIPLPANSGCLLAHVLVDEEIPDAYIFVDVCEVQPQQRAAVALRLAEINNVRKHITWSIDSDLVVIGTNADLRDVSNATATLHRSLARVCAAVQEYSESITTLARGKPGKRLSRAEREAAHIIKGL